MSLSTRRADLPDRLKVNASLGGSIEAFVYSQIATMVCPPLAGSAFVLPAPSAT